MPRRRASPLNWNACRGPPTPCRLRRDSLRSLRYERGYRACPAVAREASEGWWSQAGSNRRPRHCERRALPAELWPRRDRPGGQPTIGAIYLPGTAQVKNAKSAVLPGTSLVCGGPNRYLAVHHTSRAPPAMRAVLDIALIILDLYVWLLIASAILSWLIAFNVVNTRNQFVAAVSEFLYRITEPVLRPIRSFIPAFGGLDISPIIVILIIMFIQRVITYYIYPNVI